MRPTHLTCIAAALFGIMLLGPIAAHADSMKCSGEEKTCIANCSKIARTALSVCLTGCGARKSNCLRSGCWDNGAQKYCGLAKQ